MAVPAPASATIVPPVTLLVEAGVAWLRLNRPQQRNALNRPMLQEMQLRLREADDNQDARVIVLVGNGPAFCAGDDIAGIEAAFAGNHSDPSVPTDPVSGDALYLSVAKEITRARKPVVAAINGACAGAGTEIACAADIRVASSTARIGSGLIHVGQAGNVVMVSRVIGPAKATSLFLSGRLLDADEAQRIGLVDHVFAEATFADAAKEFALELARLPTRAIAMFKELREATTAPALEQALKLQDVYHRRCMVEIEDAVEGANAFLSRRVPVFAGR